MTDETDEEDTEGKKPLEFVPPTGATDPEVVVPIAKMQAVYYSTLIAEGMPIAMAAAFTIGWLANMMAAAIPRPYGEDPNKS